MTKYILFDLDGTLTDPKEGITKCVQYALRSFGIERDCDELVEFIGPPLKEHFMEYASLSEDDGVKAVEKYRERYRPIGVFENKIYDGILEMMSKLKEQGRVLAVATSKPTVYSRMICDKYGISPYIEFLSGSELDGRNTDKADVIRNAMEYLGASKDNTIMIGDRIHDCIGAQKNGIPFVGVSYGYASDGEFANIDFPIADSVCELSHILEKL